MTVLLCFSGAIGSGKSSVSIAVARELGWSRTAFGDYVRAEVARLGGDATSRQALQDFGQARVDTDPLAFCRDVLAHGSFTPGVNFVVDGIRHIDIFSILTVLAAPTQARLIFLEANEASRAARVEARGDRGDFARAEQHQVEAEIRDTLPGRANAVLDAGLAFDRVVESCVQLARSWLLPSLANSTEQGACP